MSVSQGTVVIPDQIRAARALLRLEQAELARRAHVAVATIRRVENPGGASLVAAETLNAIVEALRQAGAEFIPDGVRRRRDVRLDAQERVGMLRAIGLRSAARLRDRDVLTDADLYDENGLPG